MAKKHIEATVGGKKYDICVEQRLSVRQPTGTSTQDHFIFDARGALMFKIAVTKFPDRSVMVVGVECLGSELESSERRDEIGFIAGGRDVEQVFQACLEHSRHRLGKDKRLTRQEHVAHISRLSRQSRTRDQFESALKVHGYIDAKTKRNPVRRDPLEHESADGCYYFLTLAKAPIKFVVRLHVLSHETELWS